MTAAFGPRTAGKRQGDRAQHHGTCGHQYGAQAQARGFNHRVYRRAALLAQLIRKLNDQDAVFGDEAHQGDEPNLRIHVQGAAAELQRCQRTHHRQGHREQDHEGINKAFELSRQDQEDEEQGQHKDQAQRA